MNVPALTADQMREVDRVMVDDLGISLIQMMENAGGRLAELCLRRFEPSSATVLAGPGGNGGGGLVAARHLANRGVAVAVVLSDVQRMTEVPAHQLAIVHAMGVPVVHEPGSADVVVDALIGYSLRGDPRGRAAELIRWSLQQKAPVLSLDTPSGLDVTTGVAGEPSVRAAATLTLALPKTGLLLAPDHVGELYLADISVPRAVYDRFGIMAPNLFSDDTIVRIDR